MTWLMQTRDFQGLRWLTRFLDPIAPSTVDMVKHSFFIVQRLFLGSGRGAGVV